MLEKNGAADEPRRRFKFREDTANTPRASARWLKGGTASTVAVVNFPFILFALALSEHELRNSFSHLAGAPRRHLSRPVSANCRSTSTAAGPCDAIFGTRYAEDRFRH